jgi:hypothetical protein
VNAAKFTAFTPSVVPAATKRVLSADIPTRVVVPGIQTVRAGSICKVVVDEAITTLGDSLEKLPKLSFIRILLPASIAAR